MINFSQEHSSKGKPVVMGIDVGSTYTKVMLMDASRKIWSTAMGEMRGSFRELALELFQDALSKAGLKPEDIVQIVSTGYGRRIGPWDSRPVTEISCHAKGAHWLLPQAQMVIDIGGQDSKVIMVNEKGEVINFIMNDKCAAGTGRFLEVMAHALKLTLDEMGIMPQRVKECLQISSVCTVFAESEVISLLANGHSKEDIIAGIFESITQRIVGMVSRASGVRDMIVMTGGVARSTGMVRSLEKGLGTRLLLPAEPQMVGALGACLIALEGVARGVKARHSNSRGSGRNVSTT